jgi:hypothetical protein
LYIWHLVLSIVLGTCFRLPLLRDVGLLSHFLITKKNKIIIIRLIIWSSNKIRLWKQICIRAWHTWVWYLLSLFRLLYKLIWVANKIDLRLTILVDTSIIILNKLYRLTLNVILNNINRSIRRELLFNWFVSGNDIRIFLLINNL